MIVAGKDDVVSPSACLLATAVARFQVVWAGVYMISNEAQAASATSDRPVGIEAPIHTEERIAIYPPVGCGGIDRLLNFVASRGDGGLSMQILFGQQCLSN